MEIFEQRPIVRPKYYFWLDIAHYVLRILQAILSITILAVYYSMNMEMELPVEFAITGMVPITVLRLRINPKDNVHTIIHLYTSVLSVGCYGVMSIKKIVTGVSDERRDYEIVQIFLITFLTILHIVDILLTAFFSLRPVLPPPFFRSMTDFSKAYSVERETTSA